MKLTRLGEVVFSALVVFGAIMLVIVALFVPRSAGAIIAIVAVIAFGWLLRAMTDPKAKSVIDFTESEYNNDERKI